MSRDIEAHNNHVDSEDTGRDSESGHDLTEPQYHRESSGISSDEQPPSKRQKPEPATGMLSHFHELMKKVVVKQKKSPSVAEVQLDAYLQQSATGCVYDMTSVLDPILFWSTSHYSAVAPFALGLLSAPASSTAVEHTFSIASFITGGRRNRLTKKNLENEEK